MIWTYHISKIVTLNHGTEKYGELRRIFALWTDFFAFLATIQSKYYFVKYSVNFTVLYFRFVPPLDPNRAMNISIGFDNFEILKIDDKDFTVEVNVYLIVIWKDPRIGINFAQVSIFFCWNFTKLVAISFWLRKIPLFSKSYVINFVCSWAVPTEH